jgi:hypothetical protein
VSIDAFLRTYQPGDELAALVHRAQEREAAKGYSRSLIHVLAQVFIEEGARGVVAVARKIGPADVAVVPDPTIFQRIPPQDLTALSNDLGAILLGATVVTIEEALVTRAVELDGLCERFNDALTGTPFPRLDAPVGGPAALSGDAWLGMIACAGRDKTLAGFFAADGAAMPQPLREFVATLRFFPRALSLVPAYTERAQALVAAT